jgi:hypothetical protein
MIPYKTLSLMIAAAIISYTTAGYADQSSSQYIYGTTGASGEDSTAISHTEQSIHQSFDENSWWPDSNQRIQQNAYVGTYADGNDATALSYITQTANQEAYAGWSDPYSQYLLQQAGLTTFAIGNQSTAIHSADQYSEQILYGF